jgi:hypothetical protein
MSVSILETLMNAETNLIENGRLPFCVQMGKEQLHNAVALLVKDYPLDMHVEPLLGKYGEVENVPVYNPESNT